MADSPNPAMAGYNTQQPLMGAPTPGFNPLGSGNAQMDAAFAMYAMPMLMQFAGGKFIPQQFPAQNVMDQMVAMKYMQASRESEASARLASNEILAQRLNSFRRSTGGGPLTPTGAAQLNNLVGVVNNPFVMPLLEQTFGAQNVEDFFFGRKGDPVQLQRAVNSIGFYRSDSVTGADRMSEDSLKKFSEQIYNNLYGPDADLNDISGLSAGRVGSMMTDLARRGLLPQSMSKMTARERERALNELGFSGGKFGDAKLDKTVIGDSGAGQDVRDALTGNMPTDELEKLTGGADAVRKIDATRVSNALKSYSEAVASVRQIFGDNGISNAPMGQLIAALEALTQNSMSSMSPGKIENLMRRTQMAAKDSGVSLEALMGLSARGGAMAQQRGLAPEVAAFNNVMAMEHAKAMYDAGSFTPGFGRMDRDKAMLFTAEAGLNAADSRVGRYLGALSRAVAEGGSGAQSSSAARLMEAIRNGDTTFTHNGKTVNIAQELGTRPDAFINEIATAAGSGELGLTKAHFAALVRDPGTQEFSVGLEGTLALARQSEEYKYNVATQFANRMGIRQRAAGKGIADDELKRIEGQVALGFGRAVIDDVNPTMTAEERIDTLYSAMRQSFIDAGVDPADVDAKINTIFKDEEGARAFLSEQYATANLASVNMYGASLTTLQQVYNQRAIVEGTARNRKNNIRAGLNVNMGDGSDFIQRFSDALASNDGKPFLETILGGIATEDIEKQLMSGVNVNDRKTLNNTFDDMRKIYADATVDTDAERAGLVASATKDQAGFESFANQAAESGVNNFTFLQTVTKPDGTTEQKRVAKTLVDNNELETRIRARADDAKTQRNLIAVYAKSTGIDIAEAEKQFADPTKKAAAIKTLSENALLRDYASRNGLADLIDANEVTTSEVKTFVTDPAVQLFKSGMTPEEQQRIKSFGKLNAELDAGKVTGKTLAAVYGITGDKESEAIETFLKTGSESDFKTAVGKMGLSDEKAQSLEVMARFAKNANVLGGFAEMGAAGFAKRAMTSGRITAIEEAVKKGDLKEDNELIRVVAKKTAGKEALTAEEQKLLETTVGGSEEQFKAAVHKAASTSGGRDRDKVAQDVTTAARTETGKINVAAGEGGGIVGQITSAISATLGDVLKDVKIENVTITNFKLPENIGESLAGNLTSAAVTVLGNAIGGLFGGGKDATGKPAATTKPEQKSMTLSGEVTLKGLDKLVAQLRGSPDPELAPNGVPTAMTG